MNEVYTVDTTAFGGRESLGTVIEELADLGVQMTPRLEQVKTASSVILQDGEGLNVSTIEKFLNRMEATDQAIDVQTPLAAAIEEAGLSDVQKADSTTGGPATNISKVQSPKNTKGGRQ